MQKIHDVSHSITSYFGIVTDCTYNVARSKILMIATYFFVAVSVLQLIIALLHREIPDERVLSWASPPPTSGYIGLPLDAFSVTYRKASEAIPNAILQVSFIPYRPFVLSTVFPDQNNISFPLRTVDCIYSVARGVRGDTFNTLQDKQICVIDSSREVQNYLATTDDRGFAYFRNVTLTNGPPTDYSIIVEVMRDDAHTYASQSPAAVNPLNSTSNNNNNNPAAPFVTSTLSFVAPISTLAQYNASCDRLSATCSIKGTFMWEYDIASSADSLFAETFANNVNSIIGNSSDAQRWEQALNSSFFENAAEIVARQRAQQEALIHQANLTCKVVALDLSYVATQNSNLLQPVPVMPFVASLTIQEFNLQPTQFSGILSGFEFTTKFRVDGITTSTNLLLWCPGSLTPISSSTIIPDLSTLTAMFPGWDSSFVGQRVEGIILTQTAPNTNQTSDSPYERWPNVVVEEETVLSVNIDVRWSLEASLTATYIPDHEPIYCRAIQNVSKTSSLVIKSDIVGPKTLRQEVYNIPVKKNEQTGIVEGRAAVDVVFSSSGVAGGYQLFCLSGNSMDDSGGSFVAYVHVKSSVSKELSSFTLVNFPKSSSSSSSSGTNNTNSIYSNVRIGENFNYVPQFRIVNGQGQPLQGKKIFVTADVPFLSASELTTNDGIGFFSKLQVTAARPSQMSNSTHKVPIEFSFSVDGILLGTHSIFIFENPTLEVGDGCSISPTSFLPGSSTSAVRMNLPLNVGVQALKIDGTPYPEALFVILLSSDGSDPRNTTMLPSSRDQSSSALTLAFYSNDGTQLVASVTDLGDNAVYIQADQFGQVNLSNALALYQQQWYVGSYFAISGGFLPERTGLAVMCVPSSSSASSNDVVYGPVAISIPTLPLLENGISVEFDDDQGVPVKTGQVRIETSTNGVPSSFFTESRLRNLLALETRFMEPEYAVLFGDKRIAMNITDVQTDASSSSTNAFVFNVTLTAPSNVLGSLIATFQFASFQRYLLLSVTVPPVHKILLYQNVIFIDPSSENGFYDDTQQSATSGIPAWQQPILQLVDENDNGVPGISVYMSYHLFGHSALTCDDFEQLSSPTLAIPMFAVADLANADGRPVSLPSNSSGFASFRQLTVVGLGVGLAFMPQFTVFFNSKTFTSPKRCVCATHLDNNNRPQCQQVFDAQPAYVTSVSLPPSAVRGTPLPASSIKIFMGSGSGNNVPFLLVPDSSSAQIDLLPPTGETDKPMPYYYNNGTADYSAPFRLRFSASTNPGTHKVRFAFPGGYTPYVSIEIAAEPTSLEFQSAPAQDFYVGSGSGHSIRVRVLAQGSPMASVPLQASLALVQPSTQPSTMSLQGKCDQEVGGCGVLSAGIVAVTDEQGIASFPIVIKSGVEGIYTLTFSVAEAGTSALTAMVSSTLQSVSVNGMSIGAFLSIFQVTDVAKSAAEGLAAKLLAPVFGKTQTSLTSSQFAVWNAVRAVVVINPIALMSIASFPRQVDNNNIPKCLLLDRNGLPVANMSVKISIFSRTSSKGMSPSPSFTGDVATTGTDGIASFPDFTMTNGPLGSHYTLVFTTFGVSSPVIQANAYNITVAPPKPKTSLLTELKTQAYRTVGIFLPVLIANIPGSHPIWLLGAIGVCVWQLIASVLGVADDAHQDAGKEAEDWNTLVFKICSLLSILLLIVVLVIILIQVIFRLVKTKLLQGKVQQQQHQDGESQIQNNRENELIFEASKAPPNLEYTRWLVNLRVPDRHMNKAEIRAKLNEELKQSKLFALQEWFASKKLPVSLVTLRRVDDDNLELPFPNPPSDADPTRVPLKFYIGSALITVFLVACLTCSILISLIITDWFNEVLSYFPTSAESVLTVNVFGQSTDLATVGATENLVKSATVSLLRFGSRQVSGLLFLDNWATAIDKLDVFGWITTVKTTISEAQIGVYIGLALGQAVAFIAATVVIYSLIVATKRNIVLARRGKLHRELKSASINSSDVFIGTQVFVFVFQYVLVFVVIFVVCVVLSITVARNFIYKLVIAAIGAAVVAQLQKRVIGFITGMFIAKGTVIHSPLLYSMYSIYSTIIGVFAAIVGTVVRLVMSIVFSTLLFPRIDLGLFPQAAIAFDPAYSVYYSVIAVEVAYNNPVGLSFFSIIFTDHLVRKFLKKNNNNIDIEKMMDKEARTLILLPPVEIETTAKNFSESTTLQIPQERSPPAHFTRSSAMSPTSSKARMSTPASSTPLDIVEFSSQCFLPNVRTLVYRRLCMMINSRFVEKETEVGEMGTGRWSLNEESKISKIDDDDDHDENSKRATSPFDYYWTKSRVVDAESLLSDEMKQKSFRQRLIGRKWKLAMMLILNPSLRQWRKHNLIPCDKKPSTADDDNNNDNAVKIIAEPSATKRSCDQKETIEEIAQPLLGNHDDNHNHNHNHQLQGVNNSSEKEKSTPEFAINNIQPSASSEKEEPAATRDEEPIPLIARNNNDVEEKPVQEKEVQHEDGEHETM